MTQLNQIIAVEKGTKQRANKNLGEAHKMLSKLDLFMGLDRVYAPLDEEDNEVLPPEKKKIIMKSTDVLKAAADEFAELWNVTATKDKGNQKATADVVVNGNVLIEAAPVPFLLFMEKQLHDILTIAKDIPVLDPSEDWTYNENADAWRSETQMTHRTKKVPKSHVLYEATPEHPAQVQVFTEDVVVGNWSRTLFSSAMPAADKRKIIENAEAVLNAIKKAREEANSAEIENIEMAAPVLNYIFAPAGIELAQ